MMTPGHSSPISALAILAVVVLAAPAVADVLYNITDLGSITFPHAINNSGQVVGHRNGPTFLWEDGVMTDLGVVGWAYDINESTQIVGARSSVSPPAFVWEDGVVTPLPTFGGLGSKAYAINNLGDIVGWADDPEDRARAFLYADGILTDLGDLGGEQSWAFGSNDAGQVVGRAELEAVPPSGAYPRRAFLYSEGTMTQLLDVQATAYDINDLGQVVGEAPSIGGFLWEDDAVTNLWPLYEARAINDLGRVVGAGGDYGYESAFIWEDGVARDLNDPIPPDSGWARLERARDINEAGQIVGWGTLDNGDSHGFLLTPISEPGSLCLLVVGTLYVMGRPRSVRSTLPVQSC
jgi:probable HAF family extracellular repeat protein